MRAAARSEAVPAGSAVGVLVCGDTEIRELNRRFAGNDKATDVLAFPAEAPELGDIVLSMDHLESQAMQYGHSLEAEASLLAVHGFLHLLGYDHADRADGEDMRARADAVLTKLGFAGVWR